MKNTEIVYQENGDIAAVVVHSHKSLGEIHHALDLSEVPDSIVVFDTIFHAGNTNDRFLRGVVRGGKLIPASLSVESVPKNSPLRGLIARKIAQKPETLNASILSSVQQKMLAAGLGI